MARDDGGGNFGGDGSVAWEVFTYDDRDHDSRGKKRKVLSEKHGERGRMSAGFDAIHGGNFHISLRPPAGMTAAAFIAQLGRLHPSSDGRVEIDLPIEDVAQQIRLRWGPVSKD